MEKIDISTILASAIHESKNRIGTLLYQLQLMKEDNDADSKVGKSIVTIEDSLKQLNDEWVEYLYLYRLASNGYTLHLDTLKVSEFLDDQVFALLPSAAAKNLTLEFQCDDDLFADFDERLLTSVIGTAVYNAFRYAKTSILLKAVKSGSYLILSIEDDGKGFEEDEDADFLFSNNTGLGLYFAELSANAHEISDIKGHIEKSKSEELGGASLKVYLPQ